MLDADRLTVLAEAVADGHTPDWVSVEQDTPDVDLRAVIAQLRAVASIGELFSTISASSSNQGLRREVLAVGTTWGTLRILAHVGRGRHGDVYRAWDPSLDREVALKLVPCTPAEDATDSQIVHEGRLMARVKHPNVITIFGAQRTDNVTGLWMEFVEGRTLAEDLAARGPFDAENLIAVGVDLCRALAAVHEAGLVHRDVKTQNALRDVRGRIVLGDFGIGRDLQEGEDAGGGLAGTPAYLAPEIFAGRPATPQSDLYSLGALLFQLATRRYPIEGRSLRALRDAHERDERVRLATLRQDLPSSLTAAIDRALEPDPSGRFPSAEAMAQALEHRMPRGPSWLPRWPAMAALTVAALTTIGTAAFWWEQTQPPAVFAARDFVLVTAFENRTGDALLDGTMELALERELSASTFVNIVPRGRVQDTLALMRRPADERIDVLVGREVAIRDGNIRALITGRVEKIGSRYSISTDIVAANGAAVGSVRDVAASDAELLEAVDRIARKVRERLGESLTTIQVTAAPPPKVSTASLRALQLYQQARVISGEEGGEAMPRPHAVEQLLQEALREDPQFVTAHLLMAQVMRATGRHDEMRKHTELAVAAAERGTAVERALARAAWHGTQAMLLPGADGARHQGRAAAALEAVLQLDPDHDWALAGLSNVYPALGLRSDAVRVTERLLELRPNSLTGLWRASRAALANGKLDQARRYADRAVALDLPIDERTAYQEGWVRLFGAHQAAWQRRPHEAVQVAEDNLALLRTWPTAAQSPLALQLIAVYVRLGQLQRAEELVAFLHPPGLQRFTAMRIQKERMDARRLAATLNRLYPDSPGAHTVTAAFIDAGQLDRARRAITWFDTPVRHPRPGLTPRYLRLVRGKLAHAEGHSREAIGVLEAPADGEEPWRGTHQWADTVMTLAAARAAIGDVEQATALLEDATKDWAEYPEEWAYTYLRLRDRLARHYREVGRLSDADRVDAELRVLLAVADEDHPIKRRLVN
jgi:tetratricopeptide (TPR) repeat protein